MGDYGVIEFIPSSQGNADNIEFPSLTDPITANISSGEGNSGRIISFTVNVEGDYLVAFFGSSLDASMNTAIALTEAGLGSFTSNGPGSTTGMLSVPGPFTPFYAGSQGNGSAALILYGIFHLEAGQTYWFINVSAVDLALAGYRGNTTTAAATFQLLRSGGPSPGP
jgi:hypothetical protein